MRNLTDITIRHSTAVDRADLLRLAQLDEKEAPSGESLLAYAGGELVAALPLSGRSTPVADPFHLTNDVVELLRLRAAQEVKLAA